MSFESLDGKALSQEEVALIREYRRKLDRKAGFFDGIEAAVRRLHSLANECNGGAGTGDTADGFRQSASYVQDLKPAE
jgi:hypothetical protein